MEVTGPNRLDLSAFKAQLDKSMGGGSISRCILPYDRGDLKKAFMMIAEKECGGPFIVDRFNRDTVASVFAWCNGESFGAIDPITGAPVEGNPVKGVYIAGPPGTGKTALTNIMKQYARMLNLGYIAGGKTRALEWVTLFAADICDSFSKDGNLTDIKRIPSLCIQDLGAEPRGTLYMGNKVDVLGEILQYRGERHDLVTVITSNDFIKEKKYGDRVASRLVQMCNYFELRGEDRRGRGATG